MLIDTHSILVIDTNILLSSLSIVTSLIESQKWTIVIPLLVIMEPDGLSSNTEVPYLCDTAQIAMSYISSHIHSHSLSPKLRTSKGNYLSSLAVRTEEVDFDSGDGKKFASKSMDDLILKAAIWKTTTGSTDFPYLGSLLQLLGKSRTGPRWCCLLWTEIVRPIYKLDSELTSSQCV